MADIESLGHPLVYKAGEKPLMPSRLHAQGEQIGIRFPGDNREAERAPSSLAYNQPKIRIDLT